MKVFMTFDHLGDDPPYSGSRIFRWESWANRDRFYRLGRSKELIVKLKPATSSEREGVPVKFLHRLRSPVSPPYGVASKVAYGFHVILNEVKNLQWLGVNHGILEPPP